MFPGGGRRATNSEPAHRHRAVHAGVVVRPVGRLAARERLAPPTPLPRGARVVPRRRDRPRGAAPRPSLGAQPARALRARDRAAHGGRGARGRVLRRACELAARQPHLPGDVRGLRAHERLRHPRAPLRRLHRSALPLLRDARVPGALPGLDPVSAVGGLRCRPSRCRRRAVAEGGLQPPGRVRVAVDVGDYPRRVRAGLLRGQRHRVAVQRARVRADRADPRGHGRGDFRARHRGPDHLHQPGRRRDARCRRPARRRPADQPNLERAQHGRHAAARGRLPDLHPARGRAGAACDRRGVRALRRQLLPRRLRGHADDRAQSPHGPGRQLQRHHRAAARGGGPATQPPRAGGDARRAQDGPAARAPAGAAARGGADGKRDRARLQQHAVADRGLQRAAAA